MSYESTLAYISSTKWQRSKPGLTRTQDLLRALGNPEKELKFVHVGGTNGKGSTCACLAAILQQAGYKTGLYTSPYINRFNERMQINGTEIPDDELERIVDIIRPHADAMADTPTEFEVITAVAMQYFRDNGCDVVVLEVGLGGELDSTNVIDPPACAVITAIGLDHTEFLGDTLPKIAATKAGIIKEGCPVAAYPADEDVIAVLRNRCDAVGASLSVTDPEEVVIHQVALEGCTFDYGELKDLFVPLAGSYQPMNASLAVNACCLLRERGWSISDANIREGLAKVQWPGRFEVLRRNPTFVLDGAHNPHGIKATVESLKAHFGDRKLTFVMGVMADKDVQNMIGMVVPLGEIFFTARPDNHRAMEADELAGLLRGLGAEAKPCAGIQAAVDAAIAHAGADGVVMALGSLYFSSDIRNAVAANAAKKD
ncbi:MAG: bifunctional folylpolyglutamate synthase/dihydrofolate synthase [Oscillospiraceae bacterium]|nr:bifunctional folylpolyglutamate synthase/dihydrofolate synthase [Oscillospiraceae bacterium]